MANIQARRNKDGVIVSYSIRVHKGRDPMTGKQLKPYTATWKVPEGWGEKKAEKEALKQAAIFEKQCRDGLSLDNHQTFAAYAEYVLKQKERTGVKRSTLARYRVDLERILPAIGHMKLADIRPQHLNLLYEQLSQPGIRGGFTEKAYAKVDFKALLKEKDLNMHGLEVKLPGNKHHSILNLCSGGAVKAETAKMIADVLEMPAAAIFRYETDSRPLSGSTVGGYHTLVSTILAQAEKEMLIPYNPATKATPPKADDHDPNYFQSAEIARIWEALENEPIKWKTMVHLFLVTGCRRGEVLGLKWSKVDWENKQIYIDCNLLYRKELGIYEDTPKTKGSVRYIRLPDQTMELLAEYRKWYREEKFRWGDKWEDNDYLFPRENGAPMFPGYVCNWLTEFSKRHGLPHINPHAFRHTQASLLFFNGIDSVSISHRLGHAHVSTTTDIYSHVIKEAEERISDCVADVILKPAKAKLRVVGD